jgi:hypothetical protein
MRVGKHLRIRGHDVAKFLDARVVHTESTTKKKKPAKGSPWPAA